MDSPIVTQLFRQLFRHPHPACLARRHLTTPRRPRQSQLRTLSSTSSRAKDADNDDNGLIARMAPSQTRTRGAVSQAEKERGWQQRNAALPADRTADFHHFPTVTANDLRAYHDRPRRVKMLMRDFVEDSLYNPHYGYFSKQVVIFTPGKPFDFPSLRDELDFQVNLSQRYTEFEDKLDEIEPDEARQLWYTPTELFRPYYGEAIARYLVENYRHTSFPYHDLIIYEMGAGRGTLMLNILDYIRATDPDIYRRTRYRIIEISSNLASVQQRSLMADAESRGHAAKVEIINRSIFDWQQPVPEPCFFLAFEVFDNFAHDLIRYDLTTEEPMQGTVLIDEDGDFYEFFAPVTDPTINRFLRLRHIATEGVYQLPYYSRSGRGLPKEEPLWTRAARRVREGMRRRVGSRSDNLSDPEYIPTRLMGFFEVLERYFPNHQLVTSDFHSLPEALPGLNAPIVQTRYQRKPVPVTTPLVSSFCVCIFFAFLSHVMRLTGNILV